MMMVMVTNTTSDRGALDPKSDKAIRTVMTRTMTEEPGSSVGVRRRGETVS
jgi:hypothetical protein